MNSNFSFEDVDDSFTQKYDDFRENVRAVDPLLFEKLKDIEMWVRQVTNKPLRDPLGTNSVKVGIPVPSAHYKKAYANPQMFVLIKEIHTVDGAACFPIRFEEQYGSRPHWDNDRLEQRSKERRLKYERNIAKGWLDLFVFSNTGIQEIDFDTLKDLRCDTSPLN